MEKRPTDFGKYCRMLRVQRDWNMVIMAQKAGCTQPYISMLERGEVNPEFETVLAIMRAYNLQWPETKEFLANAISSFPKIRIPIESRMFPEHMLKNLMATVLAAYYDASPNEIRILVDAYEILTEMTEYLKETIDIKQRL